MKANKWEDLKQLKENRNATLRLVENAGLKLCFDAKERELASELLLPLFQVFSKELRNSRLSAIYIYRQSEQTERFSGCDGQCNIFPSSPLAAIGLSIELLHDDIDYGRMVFLHEMAHLKYSGKSPLFFLYMDILIQRYNEATGSHIVNDYKEKK